MRFQQIHSPQDIIDLVQKVGFLPFFNNGSAGIRDLSVEDLCALELWFSDTVDGPWEWKGPIARSGQCVYGKFFDNKAGFISLEWFPDFANVRRDGYDFDARYDDGLAARKDKTLYDTITEHGSLLSKELKDICNYRKGGNVGFETIITRLQMQTYVIIEDFVYMKDKHGKPYGWGVAKYSTPEKLFGYDAVTAAYKREPNESRRRLMDHLAKVLPDVPEAQRKKLLKL